MEIIKKQIEVEVGTLNFGDVFESTSGRIFMVVDATPYFKNDSSVFEVVIVDLEKGQVDRIQRRAIVRPIKLIAREE